MAIDTRPQDNREEVYNSSDRYSYYHQVMVARKFNHWLSLQIAGSLSHFNMIEETMNNDHWAISGSGKAKITPSLSAIIDYSQPLTAHQLNNPNPNVSFGVEIATSSHAFQVFIGNYYYIVPQENNVFNMNNWNPAEGETTWDNILIGFNITRLWNF